MPDWLTEQDFRDSLTAAARAWSYPEVECTSVELVVGPSEGRWRVGMDGVNLVVFRGEPFCHNDRCSHTGTYPRHALAMTSVYPEHSRGAAVREADIELNGGNHRLDRDTLGPVLVHELGHLLGLPDACSDGLHPSGRPRLGVCGEAESASVMFASTGKTAPSQWDREELCRLHPRVPSRDLTALAAALLFAVVLAVIVAGCRVVASRRAP